MSVVTLTGFMGTGKTTVGRLQAAGPIVCLTVGRSAAAVADDILAFFRRGRGGREVQP